MTSCAYCRQDESNRRFIVQGAREHARICDMCLCMYAAHVAHERGLPPPAAIAKLGAPRPYVEWPLERSLRRFNAVYWRTRAQLGAKLRGVFGKRPAKAATPLAMHFVPPAVSPLAALERRCAFCGTRDVRLYGKTARICEACVEHAAKTLLG